MKVPTTIEEWTLSVIEELVIAEYYETDTFEFKGVLVSKENRDNYRTKIRKTAGAFANSKGGFIVFGVADRDSGKVGKDRIVGIEKSDLARQFGDIVNEIEPSLHYTPQNPPMKLNDDEKHVIFVVYIPRSLKAPHAIPIDDNLAFYKRTNKGNTPMTLHEIDLAFAHRANIVSKLTLVNQSLAYISIELATLAKILEDASGEPIAGPDSGLIEVMLGDLYPLLSDDAELFNSLFIINKYCRALNSLINLFHIRKIMSKKSAVDSLKQEFSNRRRGLDAEIIKSLKILESRYEIPLNYASEQWKKLA